MNIWKKYVKYSVVNNYKLTLILFLSLLYVFVIIFKNPFSKFYYIYNEIVRFFLCKTFFVIFSSYNIVAECFNIGDLSYEYL